MSTPALSSSAIPSGSVPTGFALPWVALPADQSVDANAWRAQITAAATIAPCFHGSCSQTATTIHSPSPWTISTSPPAKDPSAASTRVK